MKNPFFGEVKRRFGFGCMRLPLRGEEVEEGEFCRMVDEYLAAGFNYFDTAHGYLNGRSEKALKKCLADRYPRRRFVLTNKLSDWCFEREEDIRPFFEEQLALCGVEYFDFYLMHAQNSEVFRKYRACRAYETAFALKREGKVRHVGLSFHDKAPVLDEILAAYPEIEVVQLQFNYADYDDPNVQSRACYNVCRKHGKPVIVMEPVKGGTLANLPRDAAEVLSALPARGSPASYALRFAASFDGVCLVLSGMSTAGQLEENVRLMADPAPLSAEEFRALERAGEILGGKKFIPCTACRYCVAGCPKKIAIPDLFSLVNAEKREAGFDGGWYYSTYTAGGGKASDCVRCGKCEKSCPQGLPIRALLGEVGARYEK